MKISILFILCLASVIASARGQIASLPGGASQTPGTNATILPAPTAFHIVERGANHRVWQRETYEKAPNGKIITHVHKYTELSTGMYYQDAQGQWAESQELIEPFPNGAVARHGRHQVAFDNNLNSQGSVALQMPNGKTLDINVLGLAYYDHSSGNSVRIGQIQDSQGELISSNQVFYLNAFSGINADVRYTYRRGGFEQDVILREQPPDPQSLGLNPDTTELEVMTEFLNPPPETIIDHSKFKHPSLDQDISWGSMALGHGKAFDLGDQRPYWDGTSVSKQYVTVNGRKVLLEMVPWKSVRTKISGLPKQASIQKTKPFLMAKTLSLPETPALKTVQRPLRLAPATPPKQGYVLDYYMFTADTNNFTFQSDTTYYINGGVNFDGTTTFEGGTVIKYSANTPSVLQLWGPAICESSEYRPIVMTSQNDNSVGDYISNSGPLFVLNEFSMAAAGDDVVMEHLRCCYADVGVHPNCNSFRLTDAQFINCGRPLCPEYVDCQLNNVLIANCTNVFWGGQYNVEASHFTVDGCESQFTAGWGDSSSDNITFTNSLLIKINSFGLATITTDHTVQLSSDAGVFQTVGAGNYYLATNSPYRTAGTTNIDPGFLADIAGKTTYPPEVVYSPNIYFSSNMTFYCQASRDTNSLPDLGYHYDPLDYLCGPLTITNSTITMMPGTAVGVFGSNIWEFGISPANNCQFESIGEPNLLNHIVEYNTVQEQVPSGWREYSFGLIYSPWGTNCLIDCRFTDFSMMAQDGTHIDDEQYDSPLGIRDCQFHGGLIQGDTTSMNFTNCLFERVSIDLEPYDDTTPSLRNNTFWNGTFGFAPALNNSVIKDNLFDGTIIPDWLGAYGSYIAGDNAYVAGYDKLQPTNSSDITLSSSPAYQTSWFGNYYLPSNSPLINAGSTTADQVGLYHFTTQTNQVAETNSIVDIGYHYVATDQYGNPIDTNGDGIPDYLEDSNGDGVYDAGDIGNWLISPYNGLSGANVLSVYTPLK